MTRKDVVRRLRAAVHEAGSQRAYARRIEVSATHINDVLRGKPPGPKILRALGIKRHRPAIVYEDAR